MNKLQTTIIQGRRRQFRDKDDFITRMLKQMQSDLIDNKEPRYGFHKKTMSKICKDLAENTKKSKPL